MIDDKEFLEYAKVFENFYGTTIKHFWGVNKGNNVIFDIDWQGTIKLYLHYKNKLLTFFILPPSREELLRDFPIEIWKIS